jgi:hypothetical protein
MGGGGTPAVAATPPPPTVNDAAVQAAKDKQAKILADAQGRQSTILTSAAGVSDQPKTGKKTLLGE